MADEQTELTDNLMLARAHGRGLFQQVMDILKLALQRRGMTAEDYYWFAMYEDGWSDEERDRMIGDSWAPEIIRRTARSDWWAIGKDKVLNSGDAPYPNEASLGRMGRKSLASSTNSSAGSPSYEMGSRRTIPTFSRTLMEARFSGIVSPTIRRNPKVSNP